MSRLLGEKPEIKSMDRLTPELPIGFMDSGLGGLSVLRQALRLMPGEDYLYYGDSLHAPYGVRPRGEIIQLTFAACDVLLKKGIKGLVVACNTATSAAIHELRAAYPELPIVGIEPAIKPAYETNQGGSILVMATPMTIRQDKYQALAAKYADEVTIRSIPCEGLVEFVEAGDLDSEKLDAYFDSHIGKWLEETETIVLGCTHYPFLKAHLRNYLRLRTSGGRPKEIRIIDGGKGTAEELKRQLAAKNLLQKEQRKGSVHIYNSCPGPDKILLSEKLLQMPF